MWAFYNSCGVYRGEIWYWKMFARLLTGNGYANEERIVRKQKLFNDCEMR